MAKLSDLLTRVHDELPAVPESLALRALSDAAKEFCTRTHAWQVSLPRISLREGKDTYDLYPDEGTQVVALTDVRLDGKKIDPIPAELVHTSANTPAPGPVTCFTQTTPTTVTVVRMPDSADRLDVRAAMTLVREATAVDVPDTILDEYGEGIAAGAKMRLTRMAAQVWSAPDLAVGYAGLFYGAIAQAKSRVRSALGEAEMQMTMRNWA